MGMIVNFHKEKQIKNIINKGSVDYFATFDVSASPGILNKINQIVDALNSSGYVASKIITPWVGLDGKFEFIRKLIESQSDVLILRLNSLMPFIFPVLIWKRLLGRKIIIDIPTPNTVVVHELRMLESNRFASLVRIGIKVVIFPWALFPANKVLQYAHESAYFSFGIKRKSQLIANGVDVASIPLRNTIPEWPGNTFVMIAVAAMAEWHGFDRVIKGIANYLRSTPAENRINIRLIVVGDGECRKLWEMLAENLEIAPFIEFVGFKTGRALDELFSEAHVAISSLGLYRIGLDISSVLKSREYAARGLPFVACGNDIDFDSSPGFVFKVENSNDPVDVTLIVEWYSLISKNKQLSAEIRQYAAEHLDFGKKLQKILEFK